MFNDLGPNRWQLNHLMATNGLRSKYTGKEMAAVLGLLRAMPSPIHALRLQQRTMMCRVLFLASTSLAATLLFRSRVAGGSIKDWARGIGRATPKLCLHLANAHATPELQLPSSTRSRTAGESASPAPPSRLAMRITGARPHLPSQYVANLNGNSE